MLLEDYQDARKAFKEGLRFLKNNEDGEELRYWLRFVSNLSIYHFNRIRASEKALSVLQHASV